MKPIALVSTDQFVHANYHWSGTTKPYLDALVYAAGAVPLLLPGYGDAIDFDRVLDAVDGVFITGARSNVHPTNYGGVASPESEPYDEARDATTMPLILRAIETGVPLLAVCRGFQELNVALGGTLASEIQTVEGRMDHRGAESADLDERFRIAHSITVKDGSLLADVLGADTVEVNSVHRQGIGTLADRLIVEAAAADGTIEAVRVRDAAGFAMGVQWHPEYWVQSDRPSQRIFEAFGDAMRAHGPGQRTPETGRL